MHTLYPTIKPYRRHDLSVDDTHTLYIEESGAQDGIPVLFIHGGPGSGTQSYQRRFFDPSLYRIILFDQRGCGRSTPHAELNANTTPLLLSDMERIRDYLKIDKWVLFGGSWGATLSLLYAQAYPQNVLGMVLRGIFLCRQKDLNWFYKDGANRIFPDAWEQYRNFINENEQSDLISAYLKRLTGNDEIARMNAAKHWTTWEAQCSTLRPSISLSDHMAESHTALSMARIEAHYFANKGFINENQILEQASRLKDIPSILIHGRYDMVCPLEQAMDLHKAWPGSTLQVIREGAHAPTEPAMADALIRATDDMAEICGNLQSGENH